jgi:hypothetical protein
VGEVRGGKILVKERCIGGSDKERKGRRRSVTNGRGKKMIGSRRIGTGLRVGKK